MKLAVFGPAFFKGAKYENYDYVARVLDEVCGYLDVTHILTGGGKGVESLALRYAAINSIEPDVTPPNIKKDGDNAFLVRNHELAEKSDKVLLLWDQLDQKYVKLIKQCAALSRPVLVYGVE